MNEDRGIHMIRAGKIGRKPHDRYAVLAKNRRRRVGDDGSPLALTGSAEVTVVLRKMRAARGPPFVARRDQNVVQHTYQLPEAPPPPKSPPPASNPPLSKP